MNKAELVAAVAEKTYEAGLEKAQAKLDNLEDAYLLAKEDLEALEDMIVLAINDANKKIDAMTEKKMGKFGNIPGLF